MNIEIIGKLSLQEVAVGAIGTMEDQPLIERCTFVIGGKPWAVAALYQNGGGRTADLVRIDRNRRRLPKLGEKTALADEEVFDSVIVRSLCGTTSTYSAFKDREEKYMRLGK